MAEIDKGALYAKTEKYLREYNSMTARLKNIDLDLQQVSDWQPETAEETIEGIYFARNKNEGMPPSGGCGDKTASVALRFRAEQEGNGWNVLSELGKTKESLECERNSLVRIVQKINNAIASLSPDEQVIVRGFYIDQRPWYEVAYEVQYVERHCKRLRTRAVWYMSKSIFGVGKVRN